MFFKVSKLDSGWYIGIPFYDTSLEDEYWSYIIINHPSKPTLWYCMQWFGFNRDHQRYIYASKANSDMTKVILTPVHCSFWIWLMTIYHLHVVYSIHDLIIHLKLSSCPSLKAFWSLIANTKGSFTPEWNTSYFSGDKQPLRKEQ